MNASHRTPIVSLSPSVLASLRPCGAAALLLLFHSNSPGVMGQGAPENLARSGMAILGLKESVESGPETELPFANSGTAENINDGNPGTRVDTYNGGGIQTASYVGILWEPPLASSIAHIDLTFALFGNGGWFGVNHTGPAGGQPLRDEHLVEPRVEVTLDGATWTSVPFTSDYFQALRGSPIGAPNSPTARFTLNTPVQNARGIRLVGTEGGTVSGGFLGVFEMEVFSPGADSDNDGMEDAWETQYGLTVGTNDAALDGDADGLTNIQEHARKTDPTKDDTDGDGLKDGAEVSQHNTHPLRADTDGDGLEDAHELNTLGTNPASKDTDQDGFADGLEISQGTDPKNADDYPPNIAIFGTGIIGVKESLDGGPETEIPHANSGTAASVNDGNLTSRVDTYGPGLAVSYVGVVWPTPVNNPISHLDLTLALFGNGGWFGPNGIDPGAGGLLGAQHLTEPRVEVSRDGGATWTVVPHTSDYISSLTGYGIGGGGNPNPNPVSATFTLAQPQAGITGIRLIGTDGGTAGGGFLGVFELATRTSPADTDNDGMEDPWERVHGLVVGENDAALDKDSDGLTNLEEFNAKTNPAMADSDGDSLADGAEVKTHQTNPLRADTDGDGLSDSVEILTHQTNPLVKDTDQDLFSDYQEVIEGTDPKSSASLPTNIAPLGRGILGKKDHPDSPVESEFPHFNSGNAGHINDSNPDTRVDTYGRGDMYSFVGVVWEAPVSDPITDVELKLALFSNGGWFGPSSTDPGAGGLLTSEYLEAPLLEITTDGGASWTRAAHTTDYLQALNEVGIGGGAFPNPNRATAKFTLNEPARNINGIRLIGQNGGTALGGFLGVFDLAAHIQRSTGPTLRNATLAAGQLRFEFTSQNGVNHRVEYRSNVASGEWQLHSTVAGDGTLKQVTATVDASEDRFFRVVNP